MLQVAVIEHGSTRYDELVALRRRILRAPLGLDFSAGQLAAEHSDVHIAAYIDGALAGGAILTPLDPQRGIVKLRQMAVDPAHRGRGIGARILAFAEEFSAARGWRRIVLTARETAVGFYERAGFAVEGEPFVEVTLPHRRMAKTLASGAEAAAHG